MVRVLFVLVPAVAVVGCSGGSPTPTRPTASGCPGALSATASASQVLTAAQQAVDCSGGYRITVRGHNFVLPLWGGIDSASVEIDAQSRAQATVERTGDGPYALVYVDGQTFFRRSSCDHWARRSGGGRDVLAPFLWSRTAALQQATGAVVVSRTADRVDVSASLAFTGAAVISFDVATARPRLLTATTTGTMQTRWTFDDWGAQPTVTPMPGGLPDQGPGGNPC